MKNGWWTCMFKHCFKVILSLNIIKYFFGYFFITFLISITNRMIINFVMHC